MQLIPPEEDMRNLVDRFKGMTVENIVSELNKSRVELQIAIENWQHDFNIGAIVRTGNAFNVNGVHIIGRQRWNRRGAMMTEKYLTLYHHNSVAELANFSSENNLKVIGIDCLEGISRPLESVQLPRNCLLLFGSEGPGLSEEAQQLALKSSGQILHITQYGSTRSINAGHAGAIAMYTWMQQHNQR
jgi:tRNA G18 (ribose-2'-O)-methylase SpoU